MKKRDIIEYLVIFINEFARHFHIGTKESYQYLRDYKALDFLESQYEVAHTMGFSYMIDAMAAYCRKNGGTLS